MNSVTMVAAWRRITIDLRDREISTMTGMEKWPIWERLRGLAAKLDLSGNEIYEIGSLLPVVYRGLTWLDLHQNHISKIVNIDPLLHLTRLHLSHNKIEHIENLGALKQLHRLDLSSNKIKEIRGLDELIYLEYLYLHNNVILMIENLDNLTQLKSLNLSQNYISRFDSLCVLTKLQYLCLNKNRVTLDRAPRLPMLRKLYLEKNFLTTLDLPTYTDPESGEQVTVFPNLEVLSLKFNNIKTVQEIEKLRILRNLKTIILAGNPKIAGDYPLQTYEVNRIARALPDVTLCTTSESPGRYADDWDST